MALPIAGFYTSGGVAITTHDFGSVEAGEFKPDSTGWHFWFYNAYGSTASDDMTSVKLTGRDTDGGIDETWVQQHWLELKSNGCSTGATIVDDAQTVFTPVGKNKELSAGDIPSGEYRIVYARCNPPTDAAEQNVDFQLRATYQQPATSICKWITDLRGNGVVGSTGNPFTMSTGSSTDGTITYNGGYALIDSNEIYYGSSGLYTVATTNDRAYTVYLGESGAFGETSGTPTDTQLPLYTFNSSGGNPRDLVDQRVFLSGLQVGTTATLPSVPDYGDIFLDTANGDLWAANSAGAWTKITDSALANPTASNIEIEECGVATYDSLQNWLDNTQSAGRVQGLQISDDSSGGIAISSGMGMMKKTTGNIGQTCAFDIASGAIGSGSLADNYINYIYVDYNAGSPQFLATSDRTTIRLQDQFTLGRIFKEGTDVHLINTGISLWNAQRRNHEQKIEVLGFKRASGGVATESAGIARALDVTSGIFFLGDNVINTNSQATSGDFMRTYFTYDGGTNWTATTGVQQVDNTNYNDTATTGLTALSVNHYGVHWVYIHYDSGIKVVYGQGDYTLAEAENASVPGSLPSVVEDFGILAAKSIIKKSATGLTSIVTSYTTPFPVSSPAEHNDLGGLNTGDYLHLTAVEDALCHSVEQTIATTTGTANIDWADGHYAYFLRSTAGSGIATFTFDPPHTSTRLQLIAQQGNAGCTGEFTYPLVYWKGGTKPTLTTSANAIDKVDFYYSTGMSNIYLGEGHANYSTV